MTGPVAPEQIDSGQFPLLPLKDMVIFPGMVVPLLVGFAVLAIASQCSASSGCERIPFTHRCGPRFLGRAVIGPPPGPRFDSHCQGFARTAQSG